MTVDIGDAPIPYDLEDIDKIRGMLLMMWGQKQVKIDSNTTTGIPTLDSILGVNAKDTKKMPSMNAGGLILKTYMSDLFNNWVNSEWVDGDNGITAVTKIDTSGGSFTIDTLNLAQKVYNMLNRIAMPGGLFKRNNNGLKNQQKLMQQAWEYEKEGMGLQYNYGQQAADAEYKRNLQMWKDTNFGAQRDEMEKAGLSVGLMYGNGGISF